VAPVREMILEAVATTSDELLEKYMEGEEFTKEEVSWALRKGVLNNEIVPVLCGTKNIGIQIILNSIVAFFPSAADTVNAFSRTHTKTGEEEIVGYNEELEPSAFVFKTIADPFVGQISLFKVATGVIKSGMPLYNTKKGETEKPSKLYIAKGKDLIEVEELHAGDIGAYSKLQYTQTNDTLCLESDPVLYEDIHYPTPYYTKAIVAAKGTEDKISTAINKLLEEDKTLRFEVNPETKQQLLSGIGDQHLDITLSKLKTKFKIDIALEEARLPYRETIRGKAQVRGKHKKQSGGHGQYGDVEIIFEPSGDLDSTYVFEEKIFGGAVPKAYFPAVEKGLAECCEKGVLAGYPMVGVKATLVDGSYHDVDSNEMAFKLATAIAYKDGIPKAKPVILEPMVNVKVYVPEDYTGDVMGDFNKRRARVMGVENEGDHSVVEAVAPQANMMTYATDLRSMTQGRGSFEMEFASYEQAPSDVEKKIIELYSVK
ncbi:MAG: elongation factor G, partial [Erysipelotrichaceae bacterium]|nr:elongation factor G [Erysipelotrichaceae bacterium]